MLCLVSPHCGILHPQEAESCAACGDIRADQSVSDDAKLEMDTDVPHTHTLDRCRYRHCSYCTVYVPHCSYSHCSYSHCINTVATVLYPHCSNPHCSYSHCSNTVAHTHTHCGYSLHSSARPTATVSGTRLEVDRGTPVRPLLANDYLARQLSCLLHSTRRFQPTR